MYYSFARVRQSLRVVPAMGSAMEAGIADHGWGFGEIVQLIDTEIIMKNTI
jgi:hypothetical protein